MKTIKFSMFAVALGVALGTQAQETYESAKIATEDLNGTARYVSMGGALDALGADLSTIRTNPAGIGLFRHSTASVSFGMVSQQDAAESSYVGGTNMSFDQAGFVYSKQSGESSFFNVAFNFTKSRNFDYILHAADKLDNASQNGISYAKYYESSLYGGSRKYNTASQLDDIYYNNLFYASGEDVAYYYPASSYDLTRGHKGYIGEYDINFSGNIRNRIFVGLTAGIHDVHYKHSGTYLENLVANDEEITSLTVNDERKITGTGFDVKAGVIIRPVENSPFRFGLSVSTPTWYSLTTRNTTTVEDNFGNKDGKNEAYDFKLFTPWKFGVSLGHTIGTMVALGAGFEFADYSTVDNRVIDGGYYDYYNDSYYNTSSEDIDMNLHTEKTLKGVCTFKLGAEVKPVPELAFRLGYNLSTAMYEENGFKDGTIDSPASYYSSASDYTNWKATNHITAGVGYTIDKLSIDLAYQYTNVKGDFKPFMEYDFNDTALSGKFGNFKNPVADSVDDMFVNAVEVANKRHQLLFTIGYHF